MGRSVETVYARALLDAAKQSGTLSSVTEEARAVIGMIKDHPGFRDLMNHPGISPEEKERVFADLFSGGLSGEMKGFLRVIFEKQRDSVLGGILEAFLDLSEKELGIGRVSVKTASPLSAEQKERVESKVRETTSYRSLEFSYETDPELIGGIVIRIGDRTADGSVRNKFQRLLETLKTAEV